MGSLKKCLSKFKAAFTSEEVDGMLASSEKYKGEGKGDLEADTMAIVDFHEKLQMKLNELRDKAKLPKEKVSKVTVEKEVAVESKANDINKVKRLIEAYNGLSFKDKKGGQGVSLNSDIQNEIKKLGYEVKRLKNKGRLRLVSDKGKAVNKSPVKRSPSQIAADRANKELKKKALNTTPISVEHAVTIDIANGKQFNLKEFLDITHTPKEEAPPLLFTNNKSGIRFEFYKNELISSGFETQMDNRDVAEAAASEVAKYFDKSTFRQQAIDKAIEIYNEINDEQGNMGMSKEQLDELNALEDYVNERELSEQEVKEELEKEEAREKVFAETGDFQKKSSKATPEIQKVVDVIKKALPKFTVKYDDKLDAAGKIQGNVITINPNYAGKDTPIHEAGHALIDFLGTKDKVVAAAIKQLQGTKLWSETKERYPELSDEQLSKEVLAEAIGREGADIFDSEVAKSKFKQVLDRIFEKIKQLLGLDKNAVKRLAKQIIRAEGTKEIITASSEEQLAKKREESEDEKELSKLYDTLTKEKDLSKFPYEDLLDAYNLIVTSDSIPKNKSAKIKSELLVRMGMNIFQRGINKAKADPKFSEAEAIKKDISYLDRHIKVLTHFSEAFPEMKFLADQFQEAYFEKTKEARKNKNINRQLAIKVIEERNKKIGLVQRGKEIFTGLFGNQNYKYFDYMDNGKGELYTVEEGKKKGFSDAQLEYLKFVRETIGERQGLIGKESYNTDMDVLKMDKKFYENFRTENAIAATSSLLGNTHNINNVRIEYTNPITGKKEVTEYENIEKVLIKYGEQGIKEKAKAVALIANYNIRARKQLKKNVNVDEKAGVNVLNTIRSGDFSLSDKGKLESKFDKPRDIRRAYSKDFYTALQEFIDDTQHVKHIGPLVPIINSIDYLNKNGVYEYDENGNETIKHEQKKNVAEWIKGWTDLHIIKRKNETDPRLDAALKFFRNLTSLTTMMFNVPAQGMNLAIGVYNNWKKENLKTVALGLSRLFTGSTINQKARGIIDKYGAVSTDMDSNPIPTIGGVFAKLGYLGTRWGEYIIQGSGLLGKMSEADWNSFEFKENVHGVKELVIKDTVKDKKALEKRILDAIDEVSDIQGKYSEKDRMNIMNNELGKSVLQFKVWIPMWFRERFGEKGSVSVMFRDGFAELRADMKEKGKIKAFWENKAFMSNLKGLMFTGLLMALLMEDDDDDEKSFASKTFKRALGDVLFVYDPNNLKFTISRPIASIGTIEKFLDAADHLRKVGADDYFDKLGNDSKKLIPAAKKIDDIVDFLDDEE